MHKHPELTETRILKALGEIKGRIHDRRHPVELSSWMVEGEPVPPEQAFAASYSPFRVGDAWGRVWGTTWFRIRGTVPSDWKGREVIVLFRLIAEEWEGLILDDIGVVEPFRKTIQIGWEGFTGEGLIYRDGKPDRAINTHRSEIDVARPAMGGETFEFFVEAAANPVLSFCTFGYGFSRDPDSLHFKVHQAELACFNREVFDFYFDFKVCATAMKALPGDSQRRAELRVALNEVLNQLDWEEPATVGRARGLLTEVLTRKNGGTVHKLSAIGHAHIDTAWLWPLRETVRKCARTFSTAVDYMDRYPEYVFGCSQAQQYDWMKAHYPDIYKRIKEKVKSGQWEPLGSMWVEVDCNLASGESLIRQMLLGKRYFLEEFGYETKDAWLPDVFGYSAALPQIFRGCGIEYFLTQKIAFNQFNKFPHHTFLWEGIDGTQIFTHFPPADNYNADISPQILKYNIANFKEHGRATRSLLVYGYGDGGGGPSIPMLEQARRLRDFDGLPQVIQEKALDFFAKAREDARDLPVWVGELYFELTRGTYTTHASTKRNNRKSEFLLRDAEFLHAMSLLVDPRRPEKAVNPDRAMYDVVNLGASDTHLHARALERAWKLVLLNQFHDIIPGSSIGWVYEDSARDYEVVRALGESVVDSALAAIDSRINTSGLKQPVRLLNTLGFARTEVVKLPDGKLRKVELPSLGYSVIDTVAPEELPARPVHVREGENGEGFVLENEVLRVSIAGNGQLKSIHDMEANRDVLAPGAEGNVLCLYADVPNANDAWDIDIFHAETKKELSKAVSVSIVESHPLRAAVRVERIFGKSRVVQKIVLEADSRRIDFDTEVDWHERHKLLKAAFPVEVRSSHATYEIQFGHLERPTHYNTSWDMARFEVCGQKWADLSEPGYGVALLNDCKYGYDIHGHIMQISLLRAPTEPDPEADQGHHLFTYSLYPHRGSFQQAGVIEAAYQLNIPPRMAALAPNSDGDLAKSFSWLRASRPGVYIEAVKRAEDGNGVIVRFYEGHGARGATAIEFGWPVKKVIRTNLIEQDQESVLLAQQSVHIPLKPFEIVTLRVI
jgi:alpha-mannosidase